MLDDLLGRTALREHIEELEDENHHLERRLDAEQGRAADAKRARQDAEERVNRLEDRIADLEGRLEQASSDEAGAGGRPTYRRTERLRGARCEAVLDRLGSVETGPEGALTAMVGGEHGASEESASGEGRRENSGSGEGGSGRSDGDGGAGAGERTSGHASGLPEAVRETLGDRAALVSRAAPCIVCADDAGLVAAALDPPLPPEGFTTWADGFRLDREWFLPTGEFALALVRSDLFALGEFEGRERRSFAGFRSEVMNRHSKGGFSQGRFERRRESQIDEHLDRCREALDERDADRLYVVGERTVLGEFRERAAATAAVDATGDPEDALEDAFREFWTTRLYGL
jgi:hypothetical protein